MKILHNIDKISAELNKNPDAVFLHSTGRMYGIGCLNGSQKATEKISCLKERPPGKGFIVLIPGFSELARYGVKVSPGELSLMKKYWPGNITFVLNSEHPDFKKIGICGTVAFRVPTSAYLRELMLRIGQPVLSTSINKASKPFAVNLSKIKKNFGNWFDFGALPKDEILPVNPIPSSIVRCYSQEQRIELIREGEIPFAELKKYFEKG
ncbi:MAG: hypothetical protein CSB55_02230 [Candidatus Cloacimonadota bacterium]|nr:MAG: hypothetical protein CSB55_02230 [Candidatus Cloacimonadota bacterium]